jgi:hypothetical protein
MEICYDGTLMMPKNYVAVDNDEMEYLVGGEVYTASQCRTFAAQMCMTGQGLIAAAAGAAIVSTIVKWSKVVGGFWGWAIGAVVGVAVAAIGKIVYGIGYSCVSGKTLSINVTPAPWDAFVDIDWI